VDAGLGRVRLHEREAVRALWRGHFEAWRLSGLTQREYAASPIAEELRKLAWPTEARGCGGPRCPLGGHPRLRHMVSPMAAPMINEAADRVPAVVTRTGRQRQFSEEDKQRFVEETCRPGQSLSAAARRYGIDLRLLVRWRRALGVGGSAAPTSFVSVERRRVGLETTRMCRPWQRRCRAVSSGEIAAQHRLLHAVGIDGCDVCEARISPRCF